MTVLYLLAAIALLVGAAAIFMALIKSFPVQWLYYHYFIRKPVVWTIFTGSLLWVTWLAVNTGNFRLAAMIPLGLMGLAVALTYCAMCRSIIPFDVTEIGPLFVASFKNANMIVADRRTRTFFQQATFDSIIGPLHPHALNMIPFQILPWGDVKQLESLPQVCQVDKNDFREFQLPVPGVWKKIMASEATPGLPAKDRDRSFPARTHVIGVIDRIASPQVAYLKNELTQKGVVRNKALDAVFVAQDDSVNAFKGSIMGNPLDLAINPDGSLADSLSGTVWDARGSYRSGSLKSDLEMVAISDEYWFSWKAFHPGSQLIRLQ